MDYNTEQMDEMKKDVLKEIANIGSGHAATALAALLNRPIEQTVPNVSLVSMADMPRLLGGAEKVAVAGMLELRGDFSGFLIMLLDLEQAERVIDLAKGEQSAFGGSLSLERFSDLDISVLSEIVNIMGGSYLTALAGFTGLLANPSIPFLCMDMIGAILNIAAAEIGKTGDYAIVFESALYNNAERIIGGLFLVPDEASCDNILESLGLI